MRTGRRSGLFFAGLIAGMAWQGGATAVLAEASEVRADEKQVVVYDADRTAVLTYNREVPAEVDLGHVESGGFFHPVKTPGGTTVTALSPRDHQYHRGIFLGWIEMHGEESADFWGWGALAPAQGRRIVSRSVPEVFSRNGASGFIAENDWIAGETVMVRERLDVEFQRQDEVNVIDLEYTLTAPASITIAQSVFSGFVFRTRTDGAVEAHSPEGRVDRPNPSHNNLETNWPAQAWYAYAIHVDSEESAAGAAVIDHPDNPESRWHNHTGIGLLNPVIVALGDVEMEADVPLVLRYRVVTFDGEVPTETLNRLADEWSR